MAEAPSQLHDALDAKAVKRNMNMLEDLRNTTRVWLKLTTKKKKYIKMLHRDIQYFFEGLTEMLCIADDEKSIWNKSEAKGWCRQCKLLKDKGQGFKVKRKVNWHKFKRLQDEEERRKLIPPGPCT